ncbi:hypothetical protein V6N12_060747 [Hibiscus sabdariffa]|uniref:Uncharacterized protein n=1 Tax=Hibiscus sabdariffa TaxID=183260 RepID=A0ABR2D5D6_9ROSI
MHSEKIDNGRSLDTEFGYVKDKSKVSVGSVMKKCGHVTLASSDPRLFVKTTWKPDNHSQALDSFGRDVIDS